MFFYRCEWQHKADPSADKVSIALSQLPTDVINRLQALKASKQLLQLRPSIRLEK